MRRKEGKVTGGEGVNGERVEDKAKEKEHSLKGEEGSRKGRRAEE